jgi:hypothetical protein
LVYSKQQESRLAGEQVEEPTKRATPPVANPKGQPKAKKLKRSSEPPQVNEEELEEEEVDEEKSGDDGTGSQEELPKQTRKPRTSYSLGMSSPFLFSRGTADKLSLVFAVEKHGKNWQKVLDDLQKNKHLFLSIDLDDYAKLNSVYKSIKQSLENKQGYKWPKVCCCTLFLIL